MPTYEYFCQKCEKSFDAVQSMKDPHFDTCPQDKCRMEAWGHGKVKRQLGTGAGLIFKGSGFYITDYRSEGYKEAAKKDVQTPAAAPAASGGEAKSGDASKTKTDAPAAPAKKVEPTPAPSKPGSSGGGGTGGGSSNSN